MNRLSIKLLVTLVLSILATSTVMTSQADARGLSGPGASSRLSATCPGVDVAAGDPDAGTGGGIAPPPPSTQKKLLGIGGGGKAGMADWINWTGRIWATLYLRAAR